MKRLFDRYFWKQLWLSISRPVERTLTQLDKASDGLLAELYHAIYRYVRYGPHEAAALSYYALFSLFPLILLIIVLGVSLVGNSARAQVGDILALFFPGETANVLQDGITLALEQRGSVSLFAAITLVWSSSSLFGNLEAVLGRTFGVPTMRRIYERRLIGLFMITTFMIFLLASLITNLLFSFLNLLFLNQFNIWLRMASFFIPTGFNAAIFAMLYGFLPRRARLRWDAILPSALLGGLAFEMAKRVFVYYLSNISTLNYIYGSVTAVVVFMLWAYLTFSLILICAEICVALNEWLGPQLTSIREESQPPTIMLSAQIFPPRLNPPDRDSRL
ncbi:MAG: YihY/virulence factor BrkB family protein [Chloroflexi bacterium]|nr:YihY/virulence factor BrkB family protein [Chloroflexota bacterium]